MAKDLVKHFKASEVLLFIGGAHLPIQKYDKAGRILHVNINGHECIFYGDGRAPRGGPINSWRGWVGEKPNYADIVAGKGTSIKPFTGELVWKVD